MLNNIENLAKQLVIKNETRNPFIIAENESIKVRAFKKPTKLLGMYSVIKRNRFIFYNPYVDEHIQNMVVAHEIGHDMLHKDLVSDKLFQEWTLFDIKSTTEYEANIFASHILLDETEILLLANQGYSYIHIAKFLGVNVNILLFKLREMVRNGYNINIDNIPKSDFFKNINGKKNIR